MIEPRRRGPSPAVVAGALAAMALPAIALAAAALPATLGLGARWSPPPPPRPAVARVSARPAAMAAAVAPPLPKATLRAGPLPTGNDASPPDLDAPPPASLTSVVAAGGNHDGYLGLAMASLAVPFGATGLLQADGLAGGGARGAFGGAALQFLVGDPGDLAAGGYAGFFAGPRGDVVRLGATGLVARGPVSAVATMGYEDVAGRMAFFDMVDLVYRPVPALALSVGHRRTDGRDLAAAGLSADMGGGLSVVGEGRFGPGGPGRDADVAAMLGLRFVPGGPGPAALPSRLVDDALARPGRRH